MKIRITREVELSSSEKELLKEANRLGYLEYREGDTTWEEMRVSYDTHPAFRTPEWFAARNHNGTYRVALRLESMGFLTGDLDAWYPTFVVTPLGKALLNDPEFENDGNIEILNRF